MVRNEGGGHVAPLGQPVFAKVDPSLQGKAAPFPIDRLPAGDYMFLVFLPGSGEQIRVVAKAEFSVR